MWSGELDAGLLLTSQDSFSAPWCGANSRVRGVKYYNFASRSTAFKYAFSISGIRGTNYYYSVLIVLSPVPQVCFVNPTPLNHSIEFYLHHVEATTWRYNVESTVSDDFPEKNPCFMCSNISTTQACLAKHGCVSLRLDLHWLTNINRTILNPLDTFFEMAFVSTYDKFTGTHNMAILSTKYPFVAVVCASGLSEVSVSLHNFYGLSVYI